VRNGLFRMTRCGIAYTLRAHLVNCRYQYGTRGDWNCRVSPVRGGTFVCQSNHGIVLGTSYKGKLFHVSCTSRRRDSTIGNTECILSLLFAIATSWNTSACLCLTTEEEKVHWVSCLEFLAARKNKRCWVHFLGNDFR